MNTCTVCNSRSKFSVNFPQNAPDEKLAFVERVCGLLIESRFRFGEAAPWDLDICASSGSIGSEPGAIATGLLRGYEWSNCVPAKLRVDQSEHQRRGSTLSEPGTIATGLLCDDP